MVKIFVIILIFYLLLLRLF